jgi:DNA-binding transcriptional regulator YdaS (Cro superfamily)
VDSTVVRAHQHAAGARKIAAADAPVAESAVADVSVVEVLTGG